MKNTMKCTKCAGEKILFIAGGSNTVGAGNNIPYGALTTSHVPVNRYLCTACGFSEEWVDMEHMEKLMKKYGE